MQRQFQTVRRVGLGWKKAMPPVTRKPCSVHTRRVGPLLAQSGPQRRKSYFRWVLSSEGKASKEEFIRCLSSRTPLPGNNTTLAPLRRFFCKLQIFMPSLKHRAEPLVRDVEQARGARHAASGILKREPDQIGLVA